MRWLPLLLVLPCVAYGLAFLAWRRGRPRMALGLLLAAGLGLRLYAAGDGFLHAWDERYHALVARNLMSHPLRPTLYEDPALPYDPADWFSNHLWLHKPPFALWLMALSMAAFGVSEWALRLPSVLLSTAAVYGTYRLGAAWRGPEVGLLAACLHSLNGALVLTAAGWWASDHVDTACASLIGLAVSAVASSASAGAFALLGLLSGLAVLSKWLPGLLPLAVGFAWHWRPGHTRPLLPRLGLAVAVAAAVVLPWWLFASRAYPAEWAWESRYNVRHFFEVLEGHARPMLFHVWNMPKTYGELVFVPLGFFFYRLARGPRDWRAVALALWIAVPYVVFSLAATKMPGYVLVAAPAVFLVQADFMGWLLGVPRATGVEGQRSNIEGVTVRPSTFDLQRKGWPRVAALVLAVLMIVFPVRILLDGLRVFRPYDRRPAWATELRQLGQRLAGSRAVILGAPRPIETMFYTSQIAYPHVPDRGTVASLAARGYRLIVCDTPGLPADRRGWPDVEYIPVQAAP